MAKNRFNGEGGDNAAAEAGAGTRPAPNPMRAQLAKRLMLSETCPDGQLFIDACREIDTLRERIRTGR